MKYHHWANAKAYEEFYDHWTRVLAYVTGYSSTEDTILQALR